MAVFFLDSSAVVKRHLNEPGSTWIVELTNPIAGNELYIASITGVEVVSAIRRKTLGSGLSHTDATTAIAQFQHDFDKQYQVVDVTLNLITQAMQLADHHALRGYDAVQLATALSVSSIGAGLRLSTLMLVSADAALNAAAVIEGLAVDDPNAHP